MEYLYFLSFHVISILSWMAVLFYLPRLYVHHQEHSEKEEFVEVVKIQEYKLYKYIGLPAMWASIISGGLLLYLNPSLLGNGWMILKLFLLALLTVYSFSMEHFRKKLESGACTKSGQFFRAYNEVPTLLSILIVLYVVTKSVPVVLSIFILLLFAFIIYKIATLKK